MKHITEADLRDLCDTQEFETFTLVEGIKLTPGGRQFLIDRKIPIIVQGEQKMRKTVSIPADDRISAHFALLEATFFKQAVELIEIDQSLADELCDMEACLASIALGEDETRVASEPCAEMTEEQHEPFQITREAMLSEHGKEIAVLHLLRCELRKFCADNQALLAENQKSDLSHLMSCLTQMIHRIGGKS